MPPHPSPLTVYRLAVRILYFTAPLSAATLLAWWLRLIPETRPVLYLMVYMLLLLVSVGAGVAALLASCHLAIVRAFSAGFQTGQASVYPEDPDTRPRHRRRGKDPLLQLVE